MSKTISNNPIPPNDPRRRNTTIGSGERRDRRRGPRDFNMSATPGSLFVRRVPDENECKRFAKIINDPRMKNKKGFPRFVKMFRVYALDSFKKGFECPEMAKVLCPNEININGCPSKSAVKRLKDYLKRLTKTYNGNLELYCTKGVMNDRTQYRWHITRFRDDHNKQVEDMEKISKSIRVAAMKRKANFEKRAYVERMQKVDSLESFFDL